MATLEFPRAQFLLGFQPLDVPDGWLTFGLAADYCLAVHPELPVTTAARNGRQLALVGYCLDPAHPERDDRAIAEDLAERADLAALLAASAGLGGRWAMAWFSADEAALFHDATGLRAVCWGRDAAGRTWCASQPALLPRSVAGDRDPEAGRFLAEFAEINAEFWWPGDRTGRTGTRRLLPNHVLYLRSGASRRWWPRASLQPAAAKDVLGPCRTILEGTLAAAVARYPLALGLSAGLDSRVVLAAGRPVIDRLCAYSSLKPDMRMDHPDADVSRRLAARLGVAHRLLRQPGVASPDLLAALAANSPEVHLVRAPGMQAELQAFHRQYVAITGNVAEIARGVYHKRALAREQASGAQLAALLGMPAGEFATRAMGDWLASVPPGTGYDLLDLCYWENRCGSWLAGNCLEFDVGWRDVLMPFNHRRLLELLLSVPLEERSGRLPPFFRTLVESMWPEALSEPVNPSPRRLPRWARRLRVLARKRGSGDA